MNDRRSSSFGRFSRSFFRCRAVIRRRLSSSVSSPTLRLPSPQETPSTSTGSSQVDVRSNSVQPIRTPSGAKPLLKPDEVQLISHSLDRALNEVDFGNEIVIRLLNDKRSLFKSLLALCAPQAHEIEVFDVQSLARFCPRAVQVGDGVTRFFNKVAEVLKMDLGSEELETKISEMCWENGQLHYRMRVWFQAENWLCVKHSVVDTVLMANSNLKRGKQLKSAGDLSDGGGAQHRRNCLNLSETLEGARTEWKSVEVVWMKLTQVMISWMKQGFLEAAMSGNEEQDEEL